MRLSHCQLCGGSIVFSAGCWNHSLLSRDQDHEPIAPALPPIEQFCGILSPAASDSGPLGAFYEYTDQDAVSEMRERMHQRAAEEAAMNRAALQATPPSAAKTVDPREPCGDCDPSFTCWGDCRVACRKHSLPIGPLSERPSLSESERVEKFMEEFGRGVLFRLESEIRDAHAACDGPVSRMAMDRVRPLAERVSALRRMVNDFWQAMPDEPEFPDEDEEPARPVNDNFMRIVCGFVGMIAGVFLAWLFLAYVK